MRRPRRKAATLADAIDQLRMLAVRPDFQSLGIEAYELRGMGLKKARTRVDWRICVPLVDAANRGLLCWLNEEERNEGLQMLLSELQELRKQPVKKKPAVSIGGKERRAMR